MAATIAPLRDYEDLAKNGLRERFPVLATPPSGVFRVATQIPSNLTERVTKEIPFVRVTQGSGRTTPTHAFPTLDIDVFSLSTTTSLALANEIEAWFTSGRHRWVDSEGNVAIVDSIECTSSPQRVPWPAATVDRFLASYVISTRRV